MKMEIYKKLSETAAIALCVPFEEKQEVWRFRSIHRTADYEKKHYKSLKDFECFIIKKYGEEINITLKEHLQDVEIDLE